MILATNISSKILAIFRKLAYTVKEKAILEDSDGFFLAIKPLNITLYNRLSRKKSK